MNDWLSDNWRIFTAGIALIVWLVRLEAKSLQNERGVRALWKQRKEDLEGIEQDRKETHAVLNEIRQDIKTLIRKVG